MQSSIHPDYQKVTITCSCGNSFDTRSTLTGGTLAVEVCAACHPFYTGLQRQDYAGGRIQRFRERYGMQANAASASDSSASSDK